MARIFSDEEMGLTSTFSERKPQLFSDEEMGFSGTPDPTMPPAGIRVGQVVSGGPTEQPRAGDSLKPVFGGNNPIADIYDTFVEPLTDWSTNRSVLDAAKDAAAFTASVPTSMLGLPTPGQLVEKGTGWSGWKDAEQGFVKNNPKIIRALGALGEVTAGAGGVLGHGFVRPSSPVVRPTRQAHKDIANKDTQRARAMVEDMESLGITPFGPVVAGARRGDNTPGAIPQALAGKPVVGTPLQQGMSRMFDEIGEAHGKVSRKYGSATTTQDAGARVLNALDGVKNQRRIDVEGLDDLALKELASTAPRQSTFKDVQSAKYELAERALPDDMKGGKAVKDEERMMVGMPETRAILMKIKEDYGKSINKTKADLKGHKDPKWTGSRNIDESLDAIASLKGEWRTGIDGMRTIRSNIRRALSSKGDTEVNALTRGNLRRLYGAVTTDMNNMLRSRAKNAALRGDRQRALQYVNALRAYDDADKFTARYAERFEAVRGVLQAKTDEAAAGKVLQAMQSGTKGNIKQLIRLRQLIPKGAIDDYASALLIELGRPTKTAGGAAKDANFNPVTFGSNWLNLDPRARKIMFGHRPGLYRELDTLAKISQATKDYQALANNSRTGVSNVVTATLAGGSIGLTSFSPGLFFGVLSAAATGRALAGFMSSPAYVRWVTRASRTPADRMNKAINGLEKLLERDGKLTAQEKQAILLAARQSVIGAQSGRQQVEPQL